MFLNRVSASDENQARNTVIQLSGRDDLDQWSTFLSNGMLCLLCIAIRTSLSTASVRVVTLVRQQKSSLEIGMLMVDFALLYASVNWVLWTDAGILNGIIYMTLTFLNPKEISRVIFIGFYQSIILILMQQRFVSPDLSITVQWPDLADYLLSRLLRVSVTDRLTLAITFYPLQSWGASEWLAGTVMCSHCQSIKNNLTVQRTF